MKRLEHIRGLIYEGRTAEAFSLVRGLVGFEYVLAAVAGGGDEMGFGDGDAHKHEDMFGWGGGGGDGDFPGAQSGTCCGGTHVAGPWDSNGPAGEWGPMPMFLGEGSWSALDVWSFFGAEVLDGSGCGAGGPDGHGDAEEEPPEWLV